MDLNSDQGQESQFNIGSAMISMIGFVLLIIGVAFGLNVVNIALELVNAKEPPAMVTKITEPCLDSALNISQTVVDAANQKDEAEPENETETEAEVDPEDAAASEEEDNPQEKAKAKDGLLRLEFSSDVKQVISYVIVFLLLTVAISFAATLVQCGVKLMRSDNSDAIKEIAARLKK